MAILEKIRKRTSVLIVAIGLALFSFVVSDFIKKGGQGDDGKYIGSINGEDIESSSFNRRVENYSRRIGGNLIYALNTIWDEQVRVSLMSEAVKRMGIRISHSLLPDVLQDNPDFKQLFDNFKDENGDFNFSNYRNYLTSIKDTNTNLFYRFMDQERYVLDHAAFGIYEDLVKAGLTYSSAEAEQKYHFEKDKENISVLKIPYSAVPDSLVNVSDEDIERYIADHPKRYEQEPEASIEYVFFEEKASPEDERSIRDELEGLLTPSEVYNSATDRNEKVPSFAKVEDVAAFVERHSDVGYSDKYVLESQISTKAKDLMALPIGGVFGPYKEGNTYRLTRKTGMTRIMDSVKSSHIIVPFKGVRSAGDDVEFSRSEAKAYVDSIFPLVKNNKKKFAEIAKEINTDGSKNSGGDIGWTRYSSISDKTFDRNFSDYIFFNKKGSIGVVESKFGYHIVRVDDRKAQKEAYKFATIQRRIEPSDDTVNAIFSRATNFELEVSEGGDFNEVAKRDSINVKEANGLKVLAGEIPGLKNSRSIVRWAFQRDVDPGTVKRFSPPEGYVLAKLKNRKPKGIKSVDDVRYVVKPILVKRKKYEILRKKYAGKSFDELSSENNFETFDATVNMDSPNVDKVGNEPDLVGCAFATDEGKISDFITGKRNVYLIKVTSKQDASPKEDYTSYRDEKNKNSVPSNLVKALKGLADIEDNRSDFY